MARRGKTEREHGQCSAKGKFNSKNSSPVHSYQSVEVVQYIKCLGLPNVDILILNIFPLVCFYKLPVLKFFFSILNLLMGSVYRLLTIT